MRIYLMTDIEGVGGVWSWDRGEWSSEDRARARRLLTGEVNAAVEGFLEGGAERVIVNDGHGYGYSIDIEDVHPQAEVIHGQQRPFWLPLLDESCDATAVVGAHAKARTPNANLCHTMSGATDGYWVNDVSIGEIGLQALIAGHYGVPFVYLSGDEHACREVEELIPGVKTTATKTGLSTLSARTFSPTICRDRIREDSATSLELLDSVKPLTLGTPLVFRERRVGADFDDTQEIEDGRIISRWERELHAKDPIELTCRLYGYDLRS